MKDSSIYCYACNHQLNVTSEEKILRTQECDYCQIQLHCCKMCIHYEKMAYNECREPMAERIVDKKKANFCSYFKIKNGKKDAGLSKNDFISAAEKLFKK